MSIDMPSSNNPENIEQTGYEAIVRLPDGTTQKVTGKTLKEFQEEIADLRESLNEK